MDEDGLIPDYIFKKNTFWIIQQRPDDENSVVLTYKELWLLVIETIRWLVFKK